MKGLSQHTFLQKSEKGTRKNRVLTCRIMNKPKYRDPIEK